MIVIQDVINFSSFTIFSIFTMFSQKHNLGHLSDQIYNRLDEAVTFKNITSFTTNVWTFVLNGNVYLSETFKELKPITGNRICKNGDCETFYLIINSQGKLINKIRI